MLKPDQISAQIAEVAAGRLSAYDFERWFRRESRNFHAYPDEADRSAIFEIESVLSEYQFAGIDESSLASELAAAIRPFERKSEKAHRMFVGSNIFLTDSDTNLALGIANPPWLSSVQLGNPVLLDKWKPHPSIFKHQSQARVLSAEA